MKQCPQCRRVYSDDTLNFCLDDGAELLYGPKVEESVDGSQAIASASEAPTRTIGGRPASAPAARPSRSKKLFYIRIGLAVLIVFIAFLGFRFMPGGDSRRAQIESIAVMPFANETGSPELEYLSDGMTESLISSLSQLPNLRVKARSSVFRYKGRENDPAAVGKELGVEAILSGRLVQQGNLVTLHVELVETPSEDTLWKHDYARPLTSVVQLQNELARDVANSLRAKLSGTEEERLTRSQTTDPEAYNLYLLGRFHLNHLTDDGFRKGVQYFREAAAKDAGFALAYAGLADAYNRLGGFNAAPPREVFPLAKEAALRALELDAELAAAHTALGTAKFYYDWDWKAAESEFKRAIELDPGHADGHHAYALFLAAMGRFDEAHTNAGTSRELEPLSLEKQIAVGDMFYLQRRFDEALAEYSRALEMDPNSGLANWALGLCYVQKKMYPEAIAAFQKSIPLSADSPDELIELARAYTLSGRKAEAVRIVDEMKSLMQQKYISPVSIGSLHIALGEPDKAFEWFERGFQERDFLLVLLKVEPMFDDVRSDPRFAQLVRRVGLR